MRLRLTQNFLAAPLVSPVAEIGEPPLYHKCLNVANMQGSEAIFTLPNRP
jgi:hypothetical protein